MLFIYRINSQYAVTEHYGLWTVCKTNMKEGASKQNWDYAYLLLSETESAVLWLKVEKQKGSRNDMVPQTY